MVEKPRIWRVAFKENAALAAAEAASATTPSETTSP
jgi:hypothetical protein